MVIVTIKISRPDLQNAARSAKDIQVSSLKKKVKKVFGQLTLLEQPNTLFSVQHCTDLEMRQPPQVPL